MHQTGGPWQFTIIRPSAHRLDDRSAENRQIKQLGIRTGVILGDFLIAKHVQNPEDGLDRDDLGE